MILKIGNKPATENELFWFRDFVKVIQYCHARLEVPACRPPPPPDQEPFLNHPDISPHLDVGTELSGRSSGRQNNSLCSILIAVTQKQLLLGKNEEVRDVEATTIRGRKGGADGIEKDCWIPLSHHPQELNVRNKRLCVCGNRWWWGWRWVVLAFWKHHGEIWGSYIRIIELIISEVKVS